MSFARQRRGGILDIFALIKPNSAENLRRRRLTPVWKKGAMAHLPLSMFPGHGSTNPKTDLFTFFKLARFKSSECKLNSSLSGSSVH